MARQLLMLFNVVFAVSIIIQNFYFVLNHFQDPEGSQTSFFLFEGKPGLRDLGPVRFLFFF